MGDSVEIIAEAPAGSLETPVYYPVGLIEDAEADEDSVKAAQIFLEYLQSEDALKVFEEYGFSPIAADGADEAEETEAEEPSEETEEAE